MKPATITGVNPVIAASFLAGRYCPVDEQEMN